MDAWADEEERKGLSFNSKLVRLKVNQSTLDAGATKFQFQIGAIKSHNC